MCMLRALHAVTVVFVAAAGAAVYNYTNKQVRRWSAWVAAFALAVCVIALHYKYNVDTVMGAGVENLDAWVISLVIMGISSLSLRFLDEQRGPTRQESRRRRRGGEKADCKALLHWSVRRGGSRKLEEIHLVRGVAIDTDFDAWLVTLGLVRLSHNLSKAACHQGCAVCALDREASEICIG